MRPTCFCLKNFIFGLSFLRPQHHDMMVNIKKLILNEDGVVGILQRIELIIAFVSNEKCYC